MPRGKLKTNAKTQKGLISRHGRFRAPPWGRKSHHGVRPKIAPERSTENGRARTCIFGGGPFLARISGPVSRPQIGSLSGPAVVAIFSVAFFVFRVRSGAFFGMLFWSRGGVFPSIWCSLLGYAFAPLLRFVFRSQIGSGMRPLFRARERSLFLGGPKNGPVFGPISGPGLKSHLFFGLDLMLDFGVVFCFFPRYLFGPLFPDLRFLFWCGFSPAGSRKRTRKFKRD